MIFRDICHPNRKVTIFLTRHKYQFSDIICIIYEQVLFDNSVMSVVGIFWGPLSPVKFLFIPGLQISSTLDKITLSQFGASFQMTLSWLV